MSDYSGSYIGIGFVFEKNSIDNAECCIKYFLRSFLSKSYTIDSYCEDKDISYVSNVATIDDFAIKKMLKEDSFCIKFESEIYSHTIQIIILCSYLDNERIIQIDFAAETFFENLDLEEILYFFKRQMFDVYKLSPFLYAVCDHEATVNYSLNELLEYGYKDYSVVMIPLFGGQMKIIQQKWQLDGITMRDDEEVGDFIIYGE